MTSPNTNTFAGPNFVVPAGIVDPEAIADRYRSDKLLTGNTGLVLRGLRADPDFRSVENDFYFRRDRMDLGTTNVNRGELHRGNTPTLAAVLSDAASRRSFMNSLDNDVAEKTAQLKAEGKRGGLFFDVLIAGGGVHAAILAARLRREAPEAQIGIIDSGNRLGGQFRSYGDRPVFYGNSRAHRRQNNSIPGLPGKRGNLNSLGIYSPLQITDFTSATNFTNIDMGDAAAVINYLSADAMVRTEFASSRLVVNQDGSQSYLTEVVDRDTGETFPIVSNLAVMATGAGERDQLTGDTSGSPNVISVEQLLSEFGNINNQFPMDRFIGRTVGIAGAKDSGNIAWELLTWLAPQQAYGRSTIQFGGVNRGLWWGCNFTNRKEFCDVTRSRYREIGNFIVRGPNDDEALIQPYRDKATVVIGATPANDQGLIVNPNQAGQDICDILVKALPLRQRIFQRLGIDPSTLSPITSTLPTTNETTAVAAVDPRSGLRFVGPNARLELTQKEKASFDPKAGGENVVAVWATGARSDAYGGLLGPAILQSVAGRRS